MPIEICGVCGVSSDTVGDTVGEANTGVIGVGPVGVVGEGVPGDEEVESALVKFSVGPVGDGPSAETGGSAGGVSPSTSGEYQSVG